MEKRFHKGIEGDILTHPERLRIPLHTKSGRHNGKPTVYAIWNDLFHETVPIVFRHAAYDVMAACGKHTFLILTKRPKEMADYLYDCSWFRHRWLEKNVDHIYHGLTVCNQAEADEKIPIFLQVPGKKFLSIEPMLGAIDLLYPAFDGSESFSAMGRIDAVILGGENGPGARPLHPDWVRSVRDQCQSAGVSFFFKGWGKHIPDLKDVFGERRDIPPLAAFDSRLHHRLLDGRPHDDLPWRKK
jgi:protein gp37